MSQTNPTVVAALARVQRVALVLGGIVFVVAIAGAFLSPAEFFHAYLVAYLFCTGMALGCFFLAMLHHLTGGIWGAILIRLLEAGMSTLPLMLVLFVPVVVGVYYLYPWAGPDALVRDPAIQHQSIYLNVPFFIVRAVLYFVVWIALAHRLRLWSLELDNRLTPALNFKLQRTSALGIAIVGLMATFAVIDWVMSLEPEWSSTVYAAMVIAGAVLGAFAFVIVAVAILDRWAPLAGVTTPGLFNDLGSLLLAFVMVWAYLGFSQFLLIYAGNLTQETPWYIHRLQGGWEWVALAVALLEFLLPFLFLLFRGLKRNALGLALVALVLVLARLIDVYWLVEPAFSPNGLSISIMHLILPVALGGLWLAFFIWHLKRYPLVPAYDLRSIEIAEAKEYERG